MIRRRVSLALDAAIVPQDNLHLPILRNPRLSERRSVSDLHTIHDDARIESCSSEKVRLSTDATDQIADCQLCVDLYVLDDTRC